MGRSVLNAIYASLSKMLVSLNEVLVSLSGDEDSLLASIACAQLITNKEWAREPNRFFESVRTAYGRCAISMWKL